MRARNEREHRAALRAGDPNGTISERIAHAITTQVIDKATHFIDMHCGDGNESLRPYSYWMLGGDERVDAASREMVLAFGLDHVVIDRNRPTDPKKSVYTSTTGTVRGKPSITVEPGGMGLTDDASVDAQERGALSVLAHLGMRAPATGVWRPVVDKLHTVAKGALLGRILDPFGNTLHEIRAPFAGELLYLVGTPPVSEGEPLAFVAEIKRE